MKISADIGVVPIGVGVSLSAHVARVVEVLRARGFDPRVHAHGSTVEGEYAEVMAALGEALERVHADGVPRISTSVKISSRTDREQSDQEKIDSVDRRLAGG